MEIREDEKEELKGGWRYLRHRIERNEPNATKTAISTWESIQNPLEEDDLIEICTDSD